jgi:hypothetical protein
VRLLALVFALGVLGLSGSAVADPSVAVVISGDENVHSTGVTQIETWLSKHNFSIQMSALDKDGTLTLSNCLAIADLACARGVVDKRSKADSVVVIIATASGPKKKGDLQLSAYWITKNHDVVSLQKMCNHCTKEVLPGTLDALMADLSKLVPAMTGKVKVTSTTDGMLAMLDGEAIGVTPVEKDVPTGPHTVKVMRDSEVLEERQITVTAGEIVKIAVAVKERPKAKVAPPPPPQIIVKKSRTLPIVVIGVGVAAAATGGVLIAVGGPTGDKRTYTDYRTPGYGVAAAGGAIAIVGVIMMLRGGTTSGPAVDVTSSGQTTVGWMGRF